MKTDLTLKSNAYIGWLCRAFSLVVIMLALCSNTLYAQSHVVTGTVTDSANKPIVGVTIYAKGLTVGTTTNTEGRYELKTPQGATLIFSSLGYSTIEVAVGTQSTIDLVMQSDDIGIDEVVVVGYGSQSRRTITSAITKVDGDVLKNTPINSVGEGLKGRIAGARVYTTNYSPGEDPKILIRGGSSINKSNDPLIIVDGVERTMAGLNPNDIESIEVLKDAASTAIYGSRGSNGVVLITTRSGRVDSAPRISFNASLAYQEPETRYDLMNARDYLSYVRPAMQFSPNSRYLATDNYSASSGNSNTSVYTPRYLDEGESVPAGWQSMLDPLDPSRTLIFQDSDWQSELYKPSLWQNYHVGIDGGSKAIQYSASVGYTSDEGVALGTGYDRFVGRINLNTQITKRLSARVLADYSKTNNDYLPNQRDQISRALSAAPTMRKYFDDGTPAYGYNASSQSPLHYNHIIDRHSSYRHLTAVGGLTYSFTDNLKANVQLSTYNNIRRWGAFQKANYFNETRPASENFKELTRNKIDGYLEYKKIFNELHSLSAMVGYSYMSISENEFAAAAEGASSDKVPTLSASPIKTNATSGYYDEVLIGYFSRINYDYKKKYLLTLTFRADGSSKFLSGNQWGYFPGVAAGWVMSDEPFMQGASWLNMLKWRVSYGQTGNNAIGAYDARGLYASNRYDGNAGIYPSKMPNASLMWEVTNQLDAGFDFSLFGNRVMTSVDYFRKVTSNLLFSKDMPNTSGFTNVQTNVGKVQFQGFDVEVTTRNIIKKDFKWTSKFVWSFVRNKVLELPDNGRDRNRIGGITLADGTAYGGIAEGEPLYRYYGYMMSHILQSQQDASNALYDNMSKGYDPITGTSISGRKFAGDYEWRNRPGSATRMVNGVPQEMIDGQDKFLLGYTVPHSTGSLSNTFDYKNFSLNILLDWALGHSILDHTESRLFINSFTSNTALSNKLKDSWTGVGDTDAKYARFATADETQSANFRTSSVFNYKANYLCIREISLAYSLPKALVNRLSIEDISIVLSGGNLHYFTAVEGVSPEVGTSSTYDSSYSNYPPIRRVSLGLNVTF